MLIGHKQTPIATRTVKEVRSKDGLDRIKLVEHKYQSSLTVVSVNEVLLYNDGLITGRYIYTDEGESLDKYQEFLFMAYNTGKQLIDCMGRLV